MPAKKRERTLLEATIAKEGKNLQLQPLCPEA